MKFQHLLLFALVLVTLGVYVAKQWRRAPLPPGPQGRLPLLGMTFDMPKEKPWLTFDKWTKEYGSIVHYRIGLQHYILVGSGAVARELLIKKAKNFSSRPPNKVGEIISQNSRSVLMPYGDHWRRVRKVFANVLTQKKCDSYLPIQEAEAIWTLAAIRDSPAEYLEELHRYSLSVARSLSFGQRVPTRGDPFVATVSKYMLQFTKAMTPGKYLFEAIPALLRLPRSMQPWMDELEPIRSYEFHTALNNYRSAMKIAEKHPDRPCIAIDVQREMRALGMDNEQQAACTCMEILGTGSETTASSLVWFIMACLTNPECVQKAHAELDRVIGHDRFPTWSDEPNLPYIRAMIKEQHRWRTIAPMSFAHFAEEEDEYLGYRIPKGSVVRICTWAMHMDSERYPEPNKFMPERFLQFPLGAAAYANSSDVAARDHFSYGDGKRICVGIHLAERSLFNLTSRLLHAFNIVRVKDEQGELIPLDTHAARSSLVMTAMPFPAGFEIRSEKIGRLLDKEFANKFSSRLSEKTE